MIGEPTRRLHAVLARCHSAADLLRAFDESDLAGQFASDLGLAELLSDAGHEAALLRHPYVAPEHVVLAGARRAGQSDRYRTLWNQLHAARVAPATRLSPIPHPLGRHSVARPDGQRQLEVRQQQAIQRELFDGS